MRSALSSCVHPSAALEHIAKARLQAVQKVLKKIVAKKMDARNVKCQRAKWIRVTFEFDSTHFPFRCDIDVAFYVYYEEESDKNSGLVTIRMKANDQDLDDQGKNGPLAGPISRSLFKRLVSYVKDLLKHQDYLELRSSRVRADEISLRTSTTQACNVVA